METGTTPKRFEMSSHLLLPLDKKSRVHTLFQKVQGAMLNVPDFGETCKAILDAVMDEIDAALDFRNVSIVANYIKVSF